MKHRAAESDPTLMDLMKLHSDIIAFKFDFLKVVSFLTKLLIVVYGFL